MWSAWDLILPIVAIFIARNIPGGGIRVAAMGYSIYLISRVVFELVAGKFLFKTNDRKKMATAIFGILCLSAGYFSFVFTNSVQLVFVSYVILGAGFGIASPAKNALFAIHLDKGRESTAWSLNDAICASVMALATALGGFIASSYGFQILFLLAGFVNLVSILPYMLYIYPSFGMWKKI